MCSIPNEGKFLKVSHFTPPISSGTVVSCLPFNRLVGAGELTEFEIVISGKIMGNPWESCRSPETMQSVPHKSTFCGNAHVVFSFIFSTMLQGHRTEGIERRHSYNNLPLTWQWNLGGNCTEGSRHLLIFKVRFTLNNESSRQLYWTRTLLNLLFDYGLS